MKNKILILLPFVIALILRIIFIEQKNLWFDEIYSWNVSQTNLKTIIEMAAGDIHPPFYYIVLKFWTLLFSDSVFSLRMLSVTFSLTGMVFIYLICRKIFKTDFEIFFVLLLYAVSPLNIFYSQEVRMFNLNLFLCLGSVYFFINYLSKPNVRNGLFYSAFTVLAFYTHYFAFLIFFTQAVILLIIFLKKEVDFPFIRNFLPYYLGVIILYIPWFGKFLYQVNKGQPWRLPQETYQFLLNTFAFFKENFFGYYFYYEGSIILALVKYITLFTFLFFVVFGLRLFIQTFKSNSTSPASNNNIAFYVFLFFVIPLAIGIIISFKNYILLSRYLSIIVPYYLIILIFFSFSIRKNYITYAIVVIFTLSSIVGTTITFSHDFKNNDYRGIISYVEKSYDDGDVITVDPHYNGWVFDYYCSHNETVLKPPMNLGWRLSTKYDSLSLKPEIKNIWFITDYSALNKTGYDEVSSKMSSLGFELESTKVFSLIPDKVKVKVEYYKRQ